MALIHKANKLFDKTKEPLMSTKSTTLFGTKLYISIFENFTGANNQQKFKKNGPKHHFKLIIPRTLFHTKINKLKYNIIIIIIYFRLKFKNKNLSLDN